MHGAGDSPREGGQAEVHEALGGVANGGGVGILGGGGDVQQDREVGMGCFGLQPQQGRVNHLQ